MTEQTRWFEYGEPTDNDRVEATLTTVYDTGPGEPNRDDDVQEGTLDIESLGLLDEEPIERHVHDDGSVLLSNVPEEAEEELLDTFEETEEEIEKASRELAEIMDELRDVHGEPVAETDEMTVFADERGYELSEIVEYHNEEHGTYLARSDVSEWMHEKAREVYGREEADGSGDPWSHADPVVVLHD